MSRPKYNSCQISVAANGWEIDANQSYRMTEGAQHAENIFVFEDFATMSKWIKDNIKPIGDA